MVFELPDPLANEVKERERYAIASECACHRSASLVVYAPPTCQITPVGDFAVRVSQATYIRKSDQDDVIVFAAGAQTYFVAGWGYDLAFLNAGHSHFEPRLPLGIYVQLWAAMAGGIVFHREAGYMLKDAEAVPATELLPSDQAEIGVVASFDSFCTARRYHVLLNTPDFQLATAIPPSAEQRFRFILNVGQPYPLHLESALFKNAYLLREGDATVLICSQAVPDWVYPEATPFYDNGQRTVCVLAPGTLLSLDKDVQQLP